MGAVKIAAPPLANLLVFVYNVSCILYEPVSEVKP